MEFTELDRLCSPVPGAIDKVVSALESVEKCSFGGGREYAKQVQRSADVCTEGRVSKGLNNVPCWWDWFNALTWYERRSALRCIKRHIEAGNGWTFRERDEFADQLKLVSPSFLGEVVTVVRLSLASFYRWCMYRPYSPQPMSQKKKKDDGSDEEDEEDNRNQNTKTKTKLHLF